MGRFAFSSSGTPVLSAGAEASQRDSAGRTALNTVTAWLANVVGLIVGFFLTRFLIDQLGERVYGLYSVGASVAAWSAFVGVPIGTYASRYATEHLERGDIPALNRTLSTSLGLSLIAALLLPLPVIFSALEAHELLRVPDDLVPSAQAAILIIGLGSVLTVVVRVWEATVFMSRRTYLKNLAETASRIVGVVVLVAWFAWFGPSVSVWLLTTVSLPLLLSIALVVPAASRGLPVKLRAVSLDRAELRRALPFVGSLAVIGVSTLLFDNTDALVISAMPELGVGQIAAYDIGTRFQKLVRPFVEAFVLALSPGLVALASRGGKSALRDNVSAHVRQLLLLSLIPTVGLAAVSEPFVAHWVGEAFVARSVPVMWIALASALLWAPGPYAFRVLVAVSRLRFVTVGALLAGLLNLGLSVFFVRFLDLGLVGVAAGTLIAVVVWSDIALGLEVCWAVDLHPLAYLRQAWLRPALACPIMILVAFGLEQVWTPQSLLETLVQLGVSMSFLSGIAFAVGLTSEERTGLRAWLAARLAQLRG